MNPLDQRLHFRLDGVIDANGNRGAAGGRDQFGGFIDGLGRRYGEGLPRTLRPCGNGCTSLAQCAGDAASSSASGACYQRDLPVQWRGCVH